MLEYRNENSEDIQIYVDNEPLYQNYLSQLAFAMSNDGTSEIPNYIYFDSDGLELYNSNTYNKVKIIREAYDDIVAGQCCNISLA